MQIDLVKEQVKIALTPKRYEHTLRVMDTAIELNEQYGITEEKVRYAALLHDYAKCLSTVELKDKLIHYQLPLTLLDYHYELWHGPVGAKLAEVEFGITDKDILNAIYYHTTGRAEMSQLEYIIFVADYIEPKRDFPGLKEVRIVAEQDLVHAAKYTVKNTIIHLMHQDSIIHPDSFQAYNYLTKIIRER